MHALLGSKVRVCGDKDANECGCMREQHAKAAAARTRANAQSAVARATEWPAQPTHAYHLAINVIDRFLMELEEGSAVKSPRSTKRSLWR
jgi:hypothetical protein